MTSRSAPCVMRIAGGESSMERASPSIGAHRIARSSGKGFPIWNGGGGPVLAFRCLKWSPRKATYIRIPVTSRECPKGPRLER